MKNWLIGIVIVAMAATLTPTDSDARRLGGGKSTGLQRDMPARTAPDAAPAKPATPAQGTPQAPAQQATAGTAAAGTAAAAGRRSWLGPIAGLAAGLGLAALMSHLGFGEAFAEFLMLALLVLAAFGLFAFIRRRLAGAAGGTPRAPALAGAGAKAPTPVAWPGSAPEKATIFARGGLETAAAAGAVATAPAAVGRVFVPAGFDAEGFERIAKMIFIRMQAANDSANLEDLRQFTTPEMFASLKVDLLDRGSRGQTTEVQRVEAQVIDVAEEAGRQVVSVRYRGELIEAAGEAPLSFDEVWHLVRPQGESGAWAIAGIEQMA